jgi:hypothetical protein
LPIIAILLGIVLVDLSFRGTEHEFAQQLGEDFGGKGFWAWLGAITIVGAIGFWSPARRISDIFMALIIFGLIFSNKGVLQSFVSDLTNPPSPSQAVQLPSFSSSSSSGGGSGSGGGGTSASSLETDYTEYEGAAAAGAVLV